MFDLTYTERQKKSRDMKRAKGQKPLQVWLSETAISQLDAYAKFHGLTRAETLEKWCAGVPSRLEKAKQEKS